MYKPTQEEILSLGFKSNTELGIWARRGGQKVDVYYMKVGFYTIEYTPSNLRAWCIGNEANNIILNPDNRGDIESLIRMLTKI